jgi:hypothetical protein
MTEELNNLNTDLKELFVNNQLDALKNTLDKETKEVVLELTCYNYEIIKKYFDSEKFNLLLQYIKFTAYSCYLCEYAADHQLIEEEDFNAMSAVFHEIYRIIQQNK